MTSEDDDAPEPVTVLEDVKVWGMLPREMAYVGAQICAVLTVVLVVSSFIAREWWLALAAVLSAFAAGVLYRLMTYLKSLVYG
jgi:hypothetical protein